MSNEQSAMSNQQSAMSNQQSAMSNQQYIRLMNHFSLGIRTWFDSWSFISRHRLGWYFLYPIAFIILWSAGASWVIGWVVDALREGFLAWTGLGELAPAEGDTFWAEAKKLLRDISRYALTFVLWIAFGWVYYKISKYIVLIMMSPVMALISERTEEITTGRRYPFSFSRLLSDVLRGVLVALRNLIIELIIIGLVTLVNFGIGIAAPLLVVIVSPLSTLFLFGVGAYFYGFSTMDYTNERQGIPIGKGTRFIRQHKWLAVANGSIFALWLIVPVFGTFVGTVIAPITCTVAATMAVLRLQNAKSNANHGGSDSDMAASA
jgi:CysZ protein